MNSGPVPFVPWGTTQGSREEVKTKHNEKAPTFHETLEAGVKDAGNFIKSPEVKEAVSGNIIIGGAITTLPGFIERLEKEVNIDFNSERSNTNLCQTISGKQLWKVRDLSNRQYSAWIGGSVLASMSNFESKCITKEEYDEYGPIMVHRKCFL